MPTPPPRPTISDVARSAGVSKATVSAVLNDSGPVSPELRLRVLNAVEALNYRPTRGPAARAGEGRSIGVLVKELDNPYFASVVAGLRAHAQSQGYALLVASSERDAADERQAVALLTAGEVAGLVVTPVLDERADLSHLFELRRRNIPFVLLGGVRGVPASQVTVDSQSGARAAAEHLIALGHERLVHFAGPPSSTQAGERAEGVRSACAAARLRFTDEDVIPAGAHLHDGHRAALAYFAAPGGGPVPAATRPTAVTCFNDLVAVGACRALAELGLRVPDDVSVVGYDDIPLLEYLTVPLTTVRVPTFEMGRVAAELLLAHVEGGPSVATRRVTLDAELVVRRSTAAPGGVTAGA
jgi:LacI family transcriptional regulator/LacI family repressor for deo operon, udp, cdd, tsx, nupC, and nupG